MAEELTGLALADAGRRGVAVARQSVDQLADVFLLDTRTRFPIVARQATAER